MLEHRRRKGFTVIEIMVVILIIGILLSLAMPSFERARASSRLISIERNLRSIDTGVEQLAMDKQLRQGAGVSQGDLDGSGGIAPYVIWPNGPVPGSYVVTAVGTNATFSDGGADMDMDTWASTCSDDPTIPACGL